MRVEMAARHVPVMLERTVELLRPRPGGTYIDATLGLGGHAAALLAGASPGGVVVGLDRDPEALAEAGSRLAAEPSPSAGTFLAVRSSFDRIAEVAAEQGLGPVDGVLYDLGVSSLQLDQPDRGFSYRFDAPLDMRMGPDGELTAADVVNTYPQHELARVLREYGEERFAARIARFVVGRRPIETTAELADIVKSAIPAATRRTGPHPARRTFQALRIEVNGELAALERSLPHAIDLLAPGGRIVVLAYHSLEDRIVKRVLAEAAGGDYVPPELPEHLIRRTPKLTLLTRRPEVPGPAEVAENPRAESAKLRAAEKLGVAG